MAATVAGRQGFIDANVAHINAVTKDWTPERRAGARLVLTAHAVPQAIEQRAPEYRQQVEADAAAIAAAAGWDRFRVAYQSAPDDVRDSWSQPMLDVVAEEEIADGAEEILCQAVGFLVDHVEVKFDLDTELQEQCLEAGIRYSRALCVHDHPSYIAALADTVTEQISDYTAVH